MRPSTAVEPLFRITVRNTRLSPIWGEVGLFVSGARSTLSVAAEAAVAPRAISVASANDASFMTYLLSRNATEAGASEQAGQRKPDEADDDVVPLVQNRLRVDDHGIEGVERGGEGIDRIEGDADGGLSEAGVEQQRRCREEEDDQAGQKRRAEGGKPGTERHAKKAKAQHDRRSEEREQYGAPPEVLTGAADRPKIGHGEHVHDRPSDGDATKLAQEDRIPRGRDKEERHQAAAFALTADRVDAHDEREEGPERTDDPEHIVDDPRIIEQAELGVAHQQQGEPGQCHRQGQEPGKSALAQQKLARLLPGDEDRRAHAARRLVRLR